MDIHNVSLESVNAVAEQSGTGKIEFSEQAQHLRIINYCSELEAELREIKQASRKVLSFIKLWRKD